MANRFWVGNGGNWSDNTNHWAASSGGAPGASLPTSADNVYFDALSFSLGSQTVTVGADANCLDMDWTGATNSPTLAGTFAIYIYGSANFTGLGTLSHTGQHRYNATATGKTITTAGLARNGTTYFEGTGGGWTFQDAFESGAWVYSSGNVNTNGKTVIINGNLYLSYAGVRIFTLGSSIVNLVGNWDYSSGTNLTLVANTATIKITGVGAFHGGGITTYNEVQLNDT